MNQEEQKLIELYRVKGSAGSESGLLLGDRESRLYNEAILGDEDALEELNHLQERRNRPRFIWKRRSRKVQGRVWIYLPVMMLVPVCEMREDLSELREAGYKGTGLYYC